MSEWPANAGAAAVVNGDADFGAFLDVPLTVRVELGRRTMKVRDVLQLKPESVMTIEKSAGENVDVYVNDRLVAFGEILETEGHAGIRITDLLEQQ